MKSASSSLPRIALGLMAGAALGVLGGQRVANAGGVATPQHPAASPQEIVALPLGVEAGVAAGARASALASSIRNPYGDNRQAVQQGKDLFIKMNCAGCHGYGAGGAMAPNLTDKYWRYGGTPVQIFKSIYEGRPQGMPAWNPALPAQEVWKLVSYIQSLGGAFTPDEYQADLQGDRAGENVAGGAKATVPSVATPAPATASATKSGKAPQNVEARPDAGGATPGGKP